MDDVFQFRKQLVERYRNFSRSFVRIAARDIRQEVERQHQYAPDARPFTVARYTGQEKKLARN